MMLYKRHDLVWLSDAGKDHALRNIQECIPKVNDKEINELVFPVPQIPAIIRRQENADTESLLTDMGNPLADAQLICIGFSSPKIIDGVRLRISSMVPSDCIIKHITPFDVVEFDKKKLPCGELLEKLIETGRNYNIKVGCFGAVAMQLATGLPYLHEKSDLDVYLRGEGRRRDLSLFFVRLSELEEQFNITIDAEIEYFGYGVKLKELFATGNTVLAKGSYDVVLLDKRSFPE